MYISSECTHLKFVIFWSCLRSTNTHTENQFPRSLSVRLKLMRNSKIKSTQLTTTQHNWSFRWIALYKLRRSLRLLFPVVNISLYYKPQLSESTELKKKKMKYMYKITHNNDKRSSNKLRILQWLQNINIIAIVEIGRYVVSWVLYFPSFEMVAIR